MLAFITRRLLLAIVTMWAITVLSFIIIQLPPGDYLRVTSAELFQAANAGCVILFTPLLVWFWGFLRRRSRDVSTADKIYYGLLLTMVSMLVMALAGAMGAHRVCAVRMKAHIFQARRYSKKKKACLQADYDELWQEFGALDQDANFVRLQPVVRKPLEEAAG